MPWFDFDQIEEELDLVVPDVLRLFLETAEAHHFPLAEAGLYDRTRALIEGNEQMRFNWEGWKKHYLAIDLNDGCGNEFFIDAQSEADDAIYLMAHDPPGIEPNGSATEFLTAIWEAYAPQS